MNVNSFKLCFFHTGGHSYCGSSSTSGSNIQLDVRTAFQDFEVLPDVDNKPRVRVGVGLPLVDLNMMLGKERLFVPHGICENVHLGGHSQTGGYSIIYRAFGLFGDHIRSFEIITADAKKVTVTKESDAEFFFAVLGGCPGNFGVLTHVIIEPHRDSDHPNSRSMICCYTYDKDRLSRLLQLAIDMSNDTTLSKDFEFAVLLMSATNEIIDFHRNRHSSIDATMRNEFEKDFTEVKEIPAIGPAFIMVSATWSNIGGASQAYDNTVKKWFENIKFVAHGFDILTLPLIEPILKRVGMYGRKVPHYEHHTAMSEVVKNLIFHRVREFNYPYVKRAYLTKERPAPEFVKTAVDFIDDVFHAKFSGGGCKVSLQIQPFGKTSQALDNRNNGTAYQWRDANICILQDIFYDPSDETAKPFAEEWVRRVDAAFIGEDGLMSKQDIRLFAYPHSNTDLSDPKVWPCYYEKAETHDRLLAFKKKIDPNQVFSANEFCLGGAKAT